MLSSEGRFFAETYYSSRSEISMKSCRPEIRSSDLISRRRAWESESRRSDARHNVSWLSHGGYAAGRKACTARRHAIVLRARAIVADHHRSARVVPHHPRNASGTRSGGDAQVRSLRPDADCRDAGTSSNKHENCCSGWTRLCSMALCASCSCWRDAPHFLTWRQLEACFCGRGSSLRLRCCPISIH